MSLPDTPLRTLTPITELTTPNLHCALTLPSAHNDDNERGRVHTGDHTSEKASAHSKRSGHSVRQPHPPASSGKLLDMALRSDSSMSLHNGIMPMDTKPLINQPKTEGESLSPARKGSTTPSEVSGPSVVPFSLNVSSPGDLLPPSRVASSSKPKHIKHTSPSSSPSPYGPASDEARRRYRERYYLRGKEVQAKRGAEAKGKEAKEKIEKEKVERNKKVGGELKERDTKVKFQDKVNVEEQTVAIAKKQSTKNGKNSAGVGISETAVRSPDNSRPSSFCSSPDDSWTHIPSLSRESSEIHLADLKSIPSYSQGVRPTLHNILTFRDDVNPRTKSTKVSSPSSKSTSRPSSVKRGRPHSFHVIRPLTVKRSSTYNGSTCKAKTPTIVQPSSFVDVSRLIVQDENERTKAPFTDALPVSAYSTSATGSNPSRSSSTRSSVEKSISSHLRDARGLARMSSIMSSIFGGNNPSQGNSSETKLERSVHRFSKRVYNAKNSAKNSKSSIPTQSPGPASPLALLGELSHEETLAGPLPVLHSSGTFGIRDDGSDVYNDHFLSTRTLPDRTGSPHTQSDRIKRILYVENHIDEPESDYTDQEAEDRVGKFYAPNGLESASKVEEHESTAAALINLHESVAPAVTFTSATNVLPDGQNYSTSSGYSHSGQTHHRAYDSFSPQIALAIPSLIGGGVNTVDTAPEMIDECTQTSLVSSPIAPAISECMPICTPSRQHSVLSHQCLATFQSAFASLESFSTSAQAELPLLIASYLLSTHATALLEHSASKDTSSILHQMAKESLEWSGILTNMAEKMSEMGNRQTTSFEASKQVPADQEIESIPRPRSGTPLALDGLVRASLTSSRKNFAGPASTQPYFNDTYDPVREAYETLIDAQIASQLCAQLDEQAQSKALRSKDESLLSSISREDQKLNQKEPLGSHIAQEYSAFAENCSMEVVKQNKEGENRGVSDDKQTSDSNGLIKNSTTSSANYQPTLSPSTALPNSLGLVEAMPDPNPSCSQLTHLNSDSKYTTSFRKTMPPRMTKLPVMTKGNIWKRRYTMFSTAGQAHVCTNPVETVQSTSAATPDHNNNQLDLPNAYPVTMTSLLQFLRDRLYSDKTVIPFTKKSSKGTPGCEVQDKELRNDVKSGKSETGLRNASGTSILGGKKR
ncbi:hypothetical protein L204_102492 [Cryptococcus depauperatus]|nr:hypothetical protein L204_00763 [Cryptococcus depauperatus CBS 7855]